MGFLIECVIAAFCVFPLQGPDETAVRAVVKSYMDAREHQNPREIEALFTVDADQLVSSGEWRRGREEVVRGTMASSRAAAGKRTITIVSVRFLTPDVAVVDGRYELALSGGDTRRMWTTVIVTQASGEWRISAIRNMLPAAQTSPPK